MADELGRRISDVKRERERRSERERVRKRETDREKVRDRQRKSVRERERDTAFTKSATRYRMFVRMYDKDKRANDEEGSFPRPRCRTMQTRERERDGIH